MIKKERSEITVPANISTGPTGPNSISVSVPYSVLTPQSSLTNQINLTNQIANQLTNSTQHLAGQPASVISMSWASTVPTTPTINTTTNLQSATAAINQQQQQLRTTTAVVNNSVTINSNTMPINAIQNTSHTVLPSSAVHLANVPTSTIAAQRTTAQTTQPIRPNLNVIQDSRSHQTQSSTSQQTVTHNSINNHPLHHPINNQTTNVNLHHVSNVSSGNIVQQQNSTTSISSNTANQHHQTIVTNQASSQASANSAAAQPQQQQFQRLKVEDALSYLDQVKIKFSNQPQVYNDFLDIMKEFKSQSIDTPGVIQRVSNLFRGHPELIVGFNTFLPPGYKIEMQANDQVNVSMPNRATSAIIISGPPGSSLQPTNQQQSTIISQQNSLPNNIQPQPTSIHLSNSTTNQLNSTVNSNSNRSLNFLSAGGAIHSSIHSSQLSNAAANQITGRQPANLIDHQVNNLNSNNSNNLNSTNGQHQSNNLSQPVEFNHAINYVNKIKNRFQGQPDVYKQFLEILHAYQKEQKSIKEGKQPDSKPLTESEVHLKVSKLFQNQDDLLQEFGQFLPESNSSSIGGGSLFVQGSIGKISILIFFF